MTTTSMLLGSRAIFARAVLLSNYDRGVGPSRQESSRTSECGIQSECGSDNAQQTGRSSWPRKPSSQATSDRRGQDAGQRHQGAQGCRGAPRRADDDRDRPRRRNTPHHRLPTAADPGPALAGHPGGDSRFRVGVGVLELSASMRSDLQSAAQPHLRVLADRTGATAHLTVWTGRTRSAWPSSNRRKARCTWRTESVGGTPQRSAPRAWPSWPAARRNRRASRDHRRTATGLRRQRRRDPARGLGFGRTGTARYDQRDRLDRRRRVRRGSRRARPRAGSSPPPQAISRSLAVHTR